MAEPASGPPVAKMAGEAHQDNAVGRWFAHRWPRQRLYARLLVLFILGLISGLSFAPIYFLPGWIVGWTGLLWSQRLARTRRGAFFDAWIWALGHFVPGIYWITSSFLIDIERFGWMAPPVIGALGAYLALYPAGAALAAWHARRNPWAHVFCLAGVWVLGEWARGWILTGFPWNLAAYIWAFATPMMQSAAIWGAWGLSLATVLATGLFTLALARSARQAMGPLVLALAILAGLYGYGAWRLAGPEPSETGISLRLVQANIAQWDKLTGRDREGQVYRHLDLSFQPADPQPAAVIWPETAATLFLDRQADWRGLISAAAPSGGYLITGALRGQPPSGEPERYWNSLYVLRRGGEILATFDKFHLVPLGEFVPLRDYLPFIGKLTGGGGNFSRGDGPATIRVPGLPSFSPLICYEIIFPGAVTEPTERPDFLLNVTNDGWFGRTSGPYQHFAIARFRAIEEGLPLVRAANSGISGIVDARGQIVAQSRLGEQVVLDVRLPGRLGPTIFQGLGLLPAIGLVIICLVASGCFATYNRKAP